MQAMQIHPARFSALAASLALCISSLVACAPASVNIAGGEPPDIAALAGADAVLLGEQHDAAAHQRIEREVVAALAARGTLGALALEMAEEGRSTQNLKPDATEAQVQQALAWDNKAWPWAAYGPVAMAAVRAGVPVLGANLPRSAMRGAMADSQLDAHLAPPLLALQQEGIRLGHCALLPEAQIAPMTRIQIARDAAMAQTLLSLRAPGKTALLVAGGGHVRRDIGVPTHLPPDLQARVVLAVAGTPADADRASTDMLWQTPALPAKDHCAGLRRQLGKG